MSVNSLPGGVQLTNININFNGVSNTNDILSELDAILQPDDLNAIMQPLTELALQSYDDVFRHALGEGNQYDKTTWVSTPSIEESSQPAGSLKTDGNKITTAGGYTIELLSATEWKITGPDGEATRIWGDPHVDEFDENGNAEGNGGWDFKRNSTFVLGDGTRINVTTVPGGAHGATVTGKLEIISGNERVVVSDVDKGIGKIGAVTQDGYAHANSFQGDVFVQGKEADDWSFNGKEIIGSRGMGESFILGDDLAAGSPTRRTNERNVNEMINMWLKGYNALGRAILQVWQLSAEPPTTRLGTNPYTGNKRPAWEGKFKYDPSTHARNLMQALQDLQGMFLAMARISSMSDRLDTMRARSNTYA